MARAEIEAGLKIARRVSSERNGWYFLARVAAAEEQWGQAADWCAKAAAHSYRHQGGDGLLLWGDVLMNLGRNEEPRAAWQLAIDRDAESESAHIAARRLEGSRAVTA